MGGADEVNRRQGHNCPTVFADPIGKRVLFAAPGRDALLWAAFAAALLRHNGRPNSVQPVAIDMSVAYVKDIRDNFGNARVVHDKFHLVKNVVDPCDQVRKTDSRAYARKRGQLKRTR